MTRSYFNGKTEEKEV